MSDEQRFTAPTDGLYRVECEGTVRGRRFRLIAAYEGNPYRDRDARLVYGQDVVRGGLHVYQNSGDASGATIVIPEAEWLEAIDEVARLNPDGSLTIPLPDGWTTEDAWNVIGRTDDSS